MQRRTSVWFSDPKPRGKRWGVLRRGGPDDPPHGTWITFETEAKAREHKRASERHLARHRSVDEARREYVAWTRATKRPAAKTILAIEQQLSYIFPDPAASLTELGARHYKRMAESGQYAVATHHVALRIARAFLEWCCDPDRLYLRENPLAKVKAIGKPNKRRHQLRRDEIEPWIAVAYDRADKGHVPSLAALSLYYLGARPCEVLGLKARDLDEGGTRIVISVSNDEDRLKTDDSHRDMMLDDPVLADFRELLIRAKKEKLPLAPLIDCTHRAITYAVHSICAAAKVPRVCPYSFRGLHGTMAVAAGQSAAAVARALGNTPKVLRAHYLQPGAERAGQRKEALRLVTGEVQSVTGGEVPEAANT